MAANLKNYASKLSKWNSTVNRKIAKKIQAKRNALNMLTHQGNKEEASTEINRLRREINDLLDREETY